MMDETNEKKVELNLSSVKEFLSSKGGRAKYSDLFNHFRDSIIESEQDEKFQEFISNIAVKKYENDSNDEWIILKKKFQDSVSPTHSGFFASTFQKTKHNLTKLSNKAFKDKSIVNTSISTRNLSKTETDEIKRSNSMIMLDKDTNEKTETDDSLVYLKKKLQSDKITQSYSLQSLNDETNVKSVKEHAKKLNRLNTESELKSKTAPSHGKVTKNIEVEFLDFTDPKPNEKDWILVCSRGDYMEIAKMLFKQPYLAQKKDPFNTVVHWACKYGNLELLKLVASTLENDTKTNPKSLRISHLINSRTGYTCLHIAYMYNHSDIVPYLKTYGAEPLTDFNGKNGIDYSRNTNYHEHHNINIDFNESKTHSPDILNDASNLVKRSNSALASKEKELKDDLGFHSVRVNENRGIRPKLLTESPLRRNQQILAHSSPLNPIETTSNVLMPPPKTTVTLKPKSKLDDSQILHESKENLFI